MGYALRWDALAPGPRVVSGGDRPPPTRYSEDRTEPPGPIAMDFVPHLASDSGRLARVVRRLEREDALSLSLLDPEGCAIALAGVEALSLRTARPVVGAGERIVRQDFEVCTEIPETSPLRSLAESLERLMVDSLDRLASSPLALRLRFNDLIVQRYRAGSSGISPHRDHVRYVGLVLVVVLAGDGRFCVCEDRSGTGARGRGRPRGRYPHAGTRFRRESGSALPLPRRCDRASIQLRPPPRFARASVPVPERIEGAVQVSKSRRR